MQTCEACRHWIKVATCGRTGLCPKSGIVPPNEYAVKDALDTCNQWEKKEES